LFGERKKSIFMREGCAGRHIESSKEMASGERGGENEESLRRRIEWIGMKDFAKGGYFEKITRE
jgi:hypothetical protein